MASSHGTINTARGTPEWATDFQKSAFTRLGRIVRQQGAVSLQRDVRDGEIVGVARDLDQLEAGWRALEAVIDEPNLFQSFDWCRLWVDAAKNAGSPDHLRILTVWGEGRLRLVWPLAVRRVLGTHVLHSLGEPATQNAGLLVEPGPDRARLVELAWTVVQSWVDIDVIELQRIRRGSDLDGLPARVRARAWSRKCSAPAFVMEDGGKTPIRSRSARTRSALRKHSRNLERVGPLTFTLAEGPGADPEAVREVLRFKRDWLLQKGMLSAGYAHPGNSAFLTQAAEQGLFVVACLRAGRRVVAVELGVRRGHTYWSLVQGYDLELAVHGPGQLLTCYLLDATVERGCRLFDFLAPPLPHKLKWANAGSEVNTLILPLSTRGQLLGRYLAVGKPWLKRVHQRLPASLRNRAAHLVNLIR